MSTRIFAIVIMVVVVLATGSVCGQEGARRTSVPVMLKFDEHASVGDADQVEGHEAEQRIMHLLAEAREMEARAGELRAEAMEIKQLLVAGREVMIARTKSGSILYNDAYRSI